MIRWRLATGSFHEAPLIQGRKRSQPHGPDISGTEVSRILTYGRKYEQPFSLDDPRLTEARREIIRNKPFLRRVYCDWYKQFEAAARSCPGKHLEIGSGGGFLKEILPAVITSDIMELKCCDVVASADRLPFGNEELSLIFMLNVLHHIQRPRLFFHEAQRTLRRTGKVLMIEPANTPFSRFIYRHFHHEPFIPAADWDLPVGGPLSTANGALPWIIFQRDRVRFQQEFPEMQVNFVRPHTPLLYLLSGGVSREAFAPYVAYDVVRSIERLLPSHLFGMFITVELERI